MEPIDLAIKKTSVKLGVAEEVVRRAVMWQWKEIRESLTHPDRNKIFIPAIGSFNFVLHKGAEKYKKWTAYLNAAKRELENCEDPSRIQALLNKIEDYEDRLDILTYKVGFTPSPQRAEKELEKAKKYRFGRNTSTIEYLREARKEKIENDKEDYKRRKKNKTPIKKRRKANKSAK